MNSILPAEKLDKSTIFILSNLLDETAVLGERSTNPPKSIGKQTKDIGWNCFGT
jgi:hypothetical protein